MTNSNAGDSPQNGMTTEMDPQAHEFVPDRVRPELAHIDTTVTRGVTQLPVGSGRNSASTNAPSTASLVPPSSSASSLFTSSIWSPQPKAESTNDNTIPRKSNWDNYMENTANLINYQISQGGGVGLGLNTSEKIRLPVTTLTSVGEKFFQNQSPVNNYALSRQSSMDGNVTPAASTFPLMQNKFTSLGQAGEHPRIVQVSSTQTNPQIALRASKSSLSQQSSVYSDKSRQLLITNGESSSVIPRAEEGHAPSVISDMSPHYLELYPELEGLKGPVVRQAIHPRSFKLPAMATGDVEEAFPGAIKVVGHLNPDYIGFPYGTRVINIKTDFVENIHHGVNAGRWSTLEAVSRRIMGVWDARKDPSEKVFFLFAVNGSKSYCALAEMKGGFEPDGHIEGWRGVGNKGVIPVQWLYVKNVSYSLFANIFQTRNNQPVVNMWNGMNIDSDTGRRVIATYVGAPHLSNVLVWTRQSNPLAVADSNYPPNNRAAHGVRGGRGRDGHITGRGGIHTSNHTRAVPAMALQNWREPPLKADNRVLGIENEQARSLQHNSQMPLHFDGSADCPPQTVFSCVMNPDGTFTPIQSNVKQQPSHQNMSQSANQSPHTDIFYQSKASNTTSPVHYQRGGLNHRGRGSFTSRGERGSFQNANSRVPYAQAHLVSNNGPVGTGEDTNATSNHGSHRLVHASSDTTIGPQSLRASSSSVSSQKSQYPYSQLHHGNPTPSTGPNLYGGSSIHPVQPADPFIANYKIDSSEPSTEGSMKYDLNEIPRTAGSDASYPGHFKSADSLAGFDARRAYQKSQAHKTPTPIAASTQDLREEQDPEQTPTRVPEHKSQVTAEKMGMWHDRTPSAIRHHPSPMELGMDMHSISNRPSLPDLEQAEMFELLALGLKARAKLTDPSPMTQFGMPSPTVMSSLTGSQMGSQMTSRRGSHMGSQTGSGSKGLPTPRFPRIPGVEDDDSFSEPRARGSSEADSTVYETPSVEGYNVSPLRDPTGRILKSASKHGSPESGLTRRGARARNAPYEEWPSSTVSDVDNLVNSPSSSIANNVHASPSQASNRSGVNKFSRAVHGSPSSIGDGSGSGGIRLEG